MNIEVLARRRSMSELGGATCYDPIAVSAQSTVAAIDYDAWGYPRT
jgi:hypothetical protein